MTCGSNSIAYSQPFFNQWPTSKAHFLPNGRPPADGEIFRQPDLARTLRAMADAEKKALAAGASREAAIDKVRDYFYRGEIAKKIDAFSKANGGLLRYEDMAAFKLHVEEPTSTTFKGYKVYKTGFWSQGPSMLEALNILEGFEDQPSYQFGGLHSSRGGGVEAGLRGSRHLLWRSEVQPYSGGRAALERVRRAAPQADYGQSFAGISAGRDSRQSRDSILPRKRWRTFRSTRC